MGAYRKKPLEIEAVQVGYAEWADPHVPIRLADGEQIPQWMHDARDQGTIEPFFGSEDYWYLRVHTVDGNHADIGPDDWLCRGIEGELYPCKNSIFQATYDRVGPDPLPVGPDPGEAVA
jgi:hypothetical protein